MSYYGDIRLGDTIDVKFCTVTTTGAPTQLAGSPVISAYPGNSTTQLTAGITLSVDFDGVTGLNNVRVVASSGNGYATATNYALIITTGTVGGTSVVGYEVGSFSIENRSALMPTTATRTLDVSAGGEAALDWANIGGKTTANDLSGTTIATSQAVASVSGAVGSVTGAVGSVTGNVGGNVVGSVASVTAAVTVGGYSKGQAPYVQSTTIASLSSQTSFTLTAGSADDDAYNGCHCLVIDSATSTQVAMGYISDYTGGTKTITLVRDPAIFTMANGDTIVIFPKLQDGVWDALIAGHLVSSTTGAALNAAGAAGDPWSTTLPGAYGAGTAGNIVGNNLDAAVTSRLAPTTAGRTLDVTATGAAGVDWGNVENTTTSNNLSGTSISTSQAIASVTGAVGSVTGNVGGNVAGSVASVTARVTANTDQLAGQTVSAAAGVTFPASVASPTNITAGTITTVTNLTNAPTSGDFTSTMKTSIGTAVAASAVASVTAPVSVTGDLSATMKTSVQTAAAAAITAAEPLDANLTQINGTTVTGDGSSGDKWGPA